MVQPLWRTVVVPNLLTPGSKPDLVDFVFAGWVALLVLAARVVFDRTAIPRLAARLHAPGGSAGSGAKPKSPLERSRVVLDSAWIAAFAACLAGFAWWVTVWDNGGCTPWSTTACFAEWPNHPVALGQVPDISVKASQKNFKKSLEKGVLKILSKMGISLLSCYHGAQIFEAYGLGKDVVDLCFRGTVSRIGGMSLADLQRESESLWAKGFPEKAMSKLEDYGFIQSKPKGEYHSNNQNMAKLLHKAIGLGAGSAADPKAYKAYQQHFVEAPVAVLRDCLEFKSDRPAIPIDQVEPVAAIMQRFCTGGMSLGAISRETHETIAIAMNRIGGKSNSGEGGEDPVRWELLADVDAAGRSEAVPHLKGLRNGDTATSRIKQGRPRKLRQQASEADGERRGPA
ncbi:Ferredoxin-dependent glutamate synthase 1, chloroplastic [Tetrabaena socialis]|uniref:Ferredoxin-dependent glutamate synthase 1, chloroplastic n=1 Tax=Tetrabaena socialis TaxID=47790 RepID=A0A2J7ZZV3_9CHLO|nr:Ferredoxin-dependent glutamate synthase 1, chloroplastic [Tetrabaena socialis]|eukprot:PNH05786.1 Ferredoxin-dependent glutamate synthase 1, chloroplastic [Tetrabaena socialis]